MLFDNCWTYLVLLIFIWIEKKKRKNELESMKNIIMLIRLQLCKLDNRMMNFMLKINDFFSVHPKYLVIWADIFMFFLFILLFFYLYF